MILLSGEVTFVLQVGDGEELIHLDSEGDYVIVPKNVWHTARTTITTKMLFITPGQDTGNKAV